VAPGAYGRAEPDTPWRAGGPESVALVGALRKLPEAQRRAVVLHHMGGLSIAEIAADEGVAEGTIKARLSRGRAALAGLLADRPATADRGAADARTAGRARAGVRRRG
jgi:RNA polymerase sigma-70 factor (ECF subfamily)